MTVDLQPLTRQTVVITGATSGIGLATARLAVERGANVVLASRDEPDLREATKRVSAVGPGRAVYAAADVADAEQVQGIVKVAEAEFGGFDTWVNNAGVSIFGDLEDVPVADARRLFETNYWGVVNGSLAAVAHLRDRGGALINVGSVLSDRSIPLQGHYCASKHAVKGFTDALRMELQRDGVPISVTLVKPSSINTPYPQHAANHMDVEATLPPPAYAPEVVAKAILACAERPQRDAYVGVTGLMMRLGTTTPRLTDKYMETVIYGQQRTDELRRPDRRPTLHEPAGGDVREDGAYAGHVACSSLYSALVLHRERALTAAATGLGLLLARRLGAARFR